MKLLKVKNAVLTSLKIGIWAFKKNLNDLEYQENNSKQVIGGSSRPKFIQVDDPRGKYVAVQIYWSFEDRPWGDVCNIPESKNTNVIYMKHTTLTEWVKNLLT